jgi:hypothetical protein
VILEENGHRTPGGAGTQRFRPLGRGRLNLVVGVLLAAVLGALLVGYLRDRGWIRIGSLQAVNQARVMYVRDLEVFLSARGDEPVGLSARTPIPASIGQGDRVLFCRAAGVFQGARGEVFDRFGVYIAGPAHRDMDAVAVRVGDGRVDVKPADITPGAPRGTNRAEDPTGPLCSTDAGEDPAGFFEEGR